MTSCKLSRGVLVNLWHKNIMLYEHFNDHLIIYINIEKITKRQNRSWHTVYILKFRLSRARLRTETRNFVFTWHVYYTFWSKTLIHTSLDIINIQKSTRAQKTIGPPNLQQSWVSENGHSEKERERESWSIESIGDNRDNFTRSQMRERERERERERDPYWMMGKDHQTFSFFLSVFLSFFLIFLFFFLSLYSIYLWLPVKYFKDYRRFCPA